MEPLAWLQDRLADLIAWLFPGRLGKCFALAVTWVLFVVLMYVVNYAAIERFLNLGWK